MNHPLVYLRLTKTITYSMFFAFTVIATFASLHAAFASPIAEVSATPLLPLSPKALTLSTTIPVGLTAARAAPRTTLTARQEFPASLLLCTDTVCGSCTEFNLSAFPAGVCEFSLAGFNSVGILQPSGQGLPFAVGVGPTCSSFAAIPEVNECFSITGGPWVQWEIFD